MSSIVIKGNTSGQVEIAAPDVAGSTTLTMPTTDGTVITNNSTVSDLPKGPAFSVLFGSTQSFSASSWTKIQYDTEDFDTNSNYSTANNRFTPTIAGYYQVNANIRFNYLGSAGDATYLALYKNGSAWTTTSRLNGTGLYGSLSLSSIVYLNGTSDYVEMYGWSNHGSPLFDRNAAVPSRFSAYLARAV